MWYIATWGLFAICKINLKLKSDEILFAYYLSRCSQIILKICTKHGSDTVVLCAKCQNDLVIKMGGMDEWVFQNDVLYCDSPLK